MLNKKVTAHTRNAIVRMGDEVVIGEGASLLEACKDARLRGHQPLVIGAMSKHVEYNTDTERVVLTDDGHWRLVRV